MGNSLPMRRRFPAKHQEPQSPEGSPIKVVLSFTIPDRLERLLVWPVLVYRRLRFGCAYRRIRLSRGKFAIVDPDDFYWLSRHKWSASGVGRTFYAVRTARGRNGRRGKTHSMHREIARTPKGLECDHINGNGLDNRKANLRSATRQQNIWNNSKRRTAWLSKYKGVSRSSSGRLWRATIIANGKSTHLGSYKDEDEAAKAYDKAARENFGQYAKLNFPNEAEKPP
jgi:hypothetical protein